MERRRWIDEPRFLHALNYCMLLPGPEAQQLATYIGWILHRTWGGVAAGVLFVLPSLLILIGLSWLYLAQGHQPLVMAAFAGLKPAVVALVALAAWRIGRRVLKHAALWAVAAAAFLSLALVGLPFPAIVLGAAAVGMVVGRWRPAWVSATAQVASTEPEATTSAACTPAACAPHTATAEPNSVRPALWRLLRLTLLFTALWGLTWGALAAWGGPQGVLARMGLFFTQAALLTFGGAYAVLPYVFQGAVEQHGWLSASQMMDGLALGETTPGPLIMVVAFVAFLGGWSADLWPAMGPFWSGAAAAVVVTWFTFLPSFFFILAGAPLVERTRGLAAVHAPLTAISAAVVGVIASLAVFLGQHTLMRPDGVPDGPAVVVCLAAGLLWGLRGWGVVPVLALAATAGALRAVVGA